MAIPEVARYTGAVSQKGAVSETYNSGNSTPGGINVLHVVVHNMYFTSDPAFSEPTNVGHDDGKIWCLLDMIVTILTFTR
jgi:hypothetical protein